MHRRRHLGTNINLVYCILYYIEYLFGFIVIKKGWNYTCSMDVIKYIIPVGRWERTHLESLCNIAYHSPDVIVPYAS
jgi:hypothetical protein